MLSTLCLIAQILGSLDILDRLLLQARPSQAPFVVAQWLRKHGRSVPTELSKKQKTELRDCFNMIDAGVFKLLLAVIHFRIVDQTATVAGFFLKRFVYHFHGHVR